MKVAYILRHADTLTQTFLRREIAGLRAHGIEVEVHALSDVAWYEWFNVPCELVRRPSLTWEGLRWLRRFAPNNAENFWSTVWAGLFALAVARRIREQKPDVLHGAWATGPATAAAILSRLCDVPFSFGAHAHDVYRHGGDAFLTPKLKAAAFAHTTTQTTATTLRTRSPDARIVIARRGLEKLPALRSSSRRPGPLRLLSVGRLVPKKGHALQLAACAELRRRAVSFEARIVGDGPLRRALERGASAGVTFRGAIQPDKMDAEYEWADVFWHTGIVDEQGDRDGLPNVIPEAFAHALPVVSSDAGGASEAKPAVIVPAGDVRALADAIERLANDESLRLQLGESGRRWVQENFLISHNVKALTAAFQTASKR